MKTFKDLNFQPYPGGGEMAREHFDNGYGASVVRHAYSYGGRIGLYELAVLKDGEIHYDNPVANGDVIGYLSEDDVSELMIEVQKL